MSTLPHTSGRHILLLLTCPGQAFFVRGVILRSSTTVVSLCFVRAIEAHRCARATSDRTCRCRRIGRYVLWNSLFPNANIACMERDAHAHVDSADPCLISTAALREVHRFARHSIYVGDGTHGWMWAGAQRSTLVLGPPRSGKTSSLVIPNILLSDGPVVSTSTKPDVMRATAPSRSSEGWAFLYDPSGEVDCPPRCRARRLVAADDGLGMGRGRRHRRRDGRCQPVERVSAAASTTGPSAPARCSPRSSMPPPRRTSPCGTSSSWIDRHDGAPALEILASGAGEDAPATDLLAGIVATDSREQSGIWSTASGVLAAYRTEGALASTRAAATRPRGVLRRPEHALRLLDRAAAAPIRPARRGDRRRRARRRLRPVPRRARRPAHPARARRGRQHRPHPRPPRHGQRGRRAGAPGAGLPAGPLPGPRPLGAGGRRVPLALRHDRRPARDRRHGDAARHQRAGGRPRGGRHDGQPLGRTAGAASAPRRRSARTRQARLPVDAVAHGAPGRALVLGPHKEVHEVALTPAHEHSPWRELAAARRAQLARRPSPTAAAAESAPEAELDRRRARATRAGPAPPRAARSVRTWSARRSPAATARLGACRSRRAARRRGRGPTAPGRRRWHAAAPDPHRVVVGVERPGSQRAQDGGSPARPPGAAAAARPRRPDRAGTQWSTRRSRADRRRRRHGRAAPKAATTSRRWAPPWGVSEITAAKRCSSSTARPWPAPAARARAPGGRRRLGPAAATPPRGRRRRRRGALAGRVAAQATRPAAARARADLVHVAADVGARGSRTRRAARARRRRSRRCARDVAGPRARRARTRKPGAQVRLVDRRRPPGDGRRSPAGRRHSSGRPRRGRGSPSRRGCAGAGRRCG